MKIFIYNNVFWFFNYEFLCDMCGYIFIIIIKINLVTSNLTNNTHISNKTQLLPEPHIYHF